MSKRLQVLLPDGEMEAIRKLARRDRVPVGEWVRKTLREARLRLPVQAPEVKLKAVRGASELAYPTADIGQMLREIERGYGE